jgi:hypothetical protein
MYCSGKFLDGLRKTMKIVRHNSRCLGLSSNRLLTPPPLNTKHHRYHSMEDCVVVDLCITWDPLLLNESQFHLKMALNRLTHAIYSENKSCFFEYLTESKLNTLRFLSNPLAYFDGCGTSVRSAALTAVKRRRKDSRNNLFLNNECDE